MNEGDLVAGRYRLVAPIARGGMGSVWRAEDSQLERPVAIKFMAAHIASDSSLRSRFNREAKAAARLRTPHVVQIFEHGVHDEQPYITMELLSGEDLHTRLRRERILPLEDAARIAAQLGRGLRVAHEQGIIHRDLKPQNVFLADEDGELVVKILDFGVAKVTDMAGEATKTGAVLGSPHYMSPEQARGLAVDPRSDVWSMAAILFRMVSGKMAFTGEATGDVIVKLCSDPIPAPSSINPALPAAVDAFFEQALERDREKRFPTPIDLARVFAEVVRSCSEASLLTPAPRHPLHRSRPQLPGPPEPPTPATGPSVAIMTESLRPDRSPSAHSRRVAITAGVLIGIVGLVAVAVVVSGDPPETTVGQPRDPRPIETPRLEPIEPARPAGQPPPGPANTPVASVTATASAKRAPRAPKANPTPAPPTPRVDPWGY